MSRNTDRLERLIESKVPKKYKPTFTRFVETSKDDEAIGIVADFVEDGAITAALRMIGDSKLAAVALLLAQKFQASFFNFVKAARSEEAMNAVAVFLARSSVEEAVGVLDVYLSRLARDVEDGYVQAGRDMADEFVAQLQGLRPSNEPVSFSQVANQVRSADTALTNSVYTVRSTVDQITQVSDKAIEARESLKAVEEARQAKDSAARAMKSIQAALQSASKIKNIPGDVTNAVTETARNAIQAAQDATRLAEDAAKMGGPGAAEEARQAAEAAKKAADEVQEAKRLAVEVENVARGLRPSVGITFDPTNPRAAQAARDLTYEFIRQVSDEQKDAVRRAVTEALQEGRGPKEAARAFRDSIGLTATQQEAVKNYRRLLESGSTEAFDRALADQRFKPKNPDNNQAYLDALTPDQIDKMVDRYEERYIQYRADTIATTEATTATSAANHEAMLQTLDAAEIDPDNVEKKWNSTKDGRTRPSHVYLGAVGNNTVMGMDTLFTSGLGNKLMYPGDLRAPAADRIRCRCVCTYRIVL